MQGDPDEVAAQGAEEAGLGQEAEAAREAAAEPAPAEGGPAAPAAEDAPGAEGAEGGDGTDGELEAAATRIQAAHRGRAARRTLAGRHDETVAPAVPIDAGVEEAHVSVPEEPRPDDPAAAPELDATAALEASEQQEQDAAPGAPEEELLPYSGDDDLVTRYLNCAKAAGRPVNPLVEGSLLESQEASQDGWAIDAPGSNKLVFSCRLGDADMRVFSQAFSSSAAQLTRLDLSCNQVTDAGAATLARSLLGARAQSLWSLSLRANAIGSPGCEVLVEALKYCPALRRLDMSQNPVGKGGGLALVELLQFSMSLLELYLADTEADIDVLVAMSTTLLLAQPGLKVLSLENPRICTKQEDHTVHLGRMLRVNTGISEIYLGKCKFRDEGIRQLVSFLMENKTLRVLDLRCNEIGADGASHLGTLLGSDCQLSLLNLSSNRIGERQNVSGARALATALLGNRMLRALDLSNNMLCGEALSSIGQALETNSTLETIALFHNEWDQESSFKFHKLLTNRARILPLRMDFVTSEVDFKIDICKVWDFTL